MKTNTKYLQTIVAAGVLTLGMGSPASADVISFKLDGNGGEGLLSTNVNGTVNGAPGTGGMNPLQSLAMRRI